MNKYKVIALAGLLGCAGFMWAEDQVVVDEAAPMGVAPVSFSGMTDMLRNMTPEQQKDFDEYLRTVEEMYGARAGDNVLPAYDPLLSSDGKILSTPSGKKDTKDTEGFFVESYEGLSSFKEIVGGVPDGISLTVKALNKRRSAKITKDQADEDGSTGKRRKNTSNRLLLYGPPGTGKTTLAAAFAREIKASFIRVKGTVFIDGYIATGTDRVHKLFEKARGLDIPVVVFIDEVDAIGRERTKERNDEYANTLVALIQELDQCEREAADRVFVILATNMFSTLDAALRSRFSNTAIEIKAPTGNLGQQIMYYYLNDYDHEPLSKTTKWWVKYWTKGFSGRDYENMINKAYILADEGKITKDHILKAMNEAYAARVSGEADKDSWFKKKVVPHFSDAYTVASALGNVWNVGGIGLFIYRHFRPVVQPKNSAADKAFELAGMYYAAKLAKASAAPAAPGVPTA